MWGKRDGVLGKCAFCREKVKNAGDKKIPKISKRHSQMPLSLQTIDALTLGPNGPCDHDIKIQESAFSAYVNASCPV